MTDDVFAEPSLVDDIEWSDLLRDLHKGRCVLFLGPTLPVYSNKGESIDFYCKAASHLAGVLADKDVLFDRAQQYNLQYISRKFLQYKKDVRIRLDDEVAGFYAEEMKKIINEGRAGLPGIYKNIAQLPWDTIINTQPDQFLEFALRGKANFHYYHYKNPQKTGSKMLEAGQPLVYNLFGAPSQEKGDYILDSLVLTEEDQVDYVRNIIKDYPQIPESVVSRFDESKRYIFLDFNFENWHFRLLLEALKLKKNFLPISAQHARTNFSYYTKDFYKNRYGFLFIKNNSEEFMQELVNRYLEKYNTAKETNRAEKKLFIAYCDQDENSTFNLSSQLRPWIEKKLISLWLRTKRDPGEAVSKEADAFNEADCIVLMISADSLESKFYDKYIRPALQMSAERTKKVIAVITRECNWQETDINELPFILPEDKMALSADNGQTIDQKFKAAAAAIINSLW
jgi:hypothetical protein